MLPSRLVIVSRESVLAMWQARHIESRLSELYPGITLSILGMTTEGDRKLGTSLAKIGGKGLFIKELELALESGQADIAVHSMKDVPMTLPDGFELVATGEREDPRDAFVSNQYPNLAGLPAGTLNDADDEDDDPSDRVGGDAGEGVGERGGVFAAAFRGDEAKAFCAVEEFHGADCHRSASE